MLDDVEEILKKYNETEIKIENLYQQSLNSIDDQNTGANKERRQGLFPSFEKAKERNKQLLKDLEIVKGNLRSKAIFSPTEMQWEKICKEYQKEPSLAVTTWKCNLPVFV